MRPENLASIRVLAKLGFRKEGLFRRYLDVDARQYAAERGPCLDAARSHQPVRAVVAEHRERWPEFTEAAERAGARAYLAAPLVLDKSGTAS